MFNNIIMDLKAQYISITVMEKTLHKQPARTSKNRKYITVYITSSIIRSSNHIIKTRCIYCLSLKQIGGNKRALILSLDTTCFNISKIEEWFGLEAYLESWICVGSQGEGGGGSGNLKCCRPIGREVPQ